MLDGRSVVPSNLGFGFQDLTAAIFPRLEIDVMRTAAFPTFLILDVGRARERVV
jgi:hypothetical protein